MKIAGMQSVSTTDYEGEVASIIFLAGCNLRCPYCYNYKINQQGVTNLVTEDLIIKRLVNNKVITAVVISGGEPTIHDDLIPFIKRIKRETGLKVKLFTNGINYIDIIRTLPYIDAVSVDYKTMPHMYEKLGASHNQIESFKKLVAEIKTWNIDLEFRCTLAPWFTDDTVVETIRKRVAPFRLILQDAILEDVLDPSFFQDQK